MKNKSFIAVIVCLIAVVIIGLVVFNKMDSKNGATKSNDTSTNKVTEAVTDNMEDETTQALETTQEQKDHSKGNGNNSAEDIFFEGAENQNEDAASQNSDDEKNNEDADSDGEWSELY